MEKKNTEVFEPICFYPGDEAGQKEGENHQSIRAKFSIYTREQDRTTP